MQITAAELTTLDVEPGGQSVRMNMRDSDGQPAAVVWPFQCLTQLLMTLPSIIQRALRQQHGDASLRLVHELKGYSIELGEESAAGVRQLIVTLATNGGFYVSFSMSETELTSMSSPDDDDGMPRDEQVSSTARRLC